MKRILVILSLAIFMVSMTVAETTNITYSGVIADDNGNPVVNENIDIQISILRDGTSVFTENISTTTDEFSMVNFMFADGNTIDWSYGEFSTLVTIDLAGGSISGEALIGAVPIALYAKEAQHALTADVATVAESANSVDVENIVGLDLSQYLTAEDIENQIQDLQLVGNILTITQNDVATEIDLSIYLDNTNTQVTATEIIQIITDAGFLLIEGDASELNEIQNLQLNGHILTITLNDQATEIDLSPYLDDTHLSAEDIDAYGFQRIANAFDGNYDSLNDPPNINDSIQNALDTTQKFVRKEDEKSIDLFEVDDGGNLTIGEGGVVHSISREVIIRTDAEIEAMGYVKLSTVLELFEAQNVLIGDLTGDLAVMQESLVANDSLQKQNQRVMEDLMAFHNYQPPTGDTPGDPGSVTFNLYGGEEVTYGTIVVNGVIFLDRNLGATQVATSSTDPLSFGDYFQWGREADGHQFITSATTYDKAPAREQPGHSDFFTISKNIDDWNQDSLWAYRWDIPNYIVNNNVCPDGWHVATRNDWIQVLKAIPQNNAEQLFLALNLPLAGVRSDFNGDMQSLGVYGFYPSSKMKNHAYAYGIMFNSSSAYEASLVKSKGFPIRCAMDPLPVEEE